MPLPKSLTTAKKSTLLMHVLPPVLLVAACWAATTVATTTYLQWKDAIFQKELTDIGHAGQAANRFHLASLHLLQLWREPPSVARSAEIDRQRLLLEDNLRLLASFARDPREQANIDKMKEHLERLNQTLDDLSVNQRPLADLIALVIPLKSAGTQIFEFQHQRWQAATTERQRIQYQILWARSIALILGPFVGIYFGWRLTQHLQQRVAVLTVTLRQGATPQDFELGNVEIPSVPDLQQAQELAEVVGRRMQQLMADLDEARREVIQAERLAAVGELAAGVAHELRNPLTSVKLLLQVSQHQPNPLATGHERIELILSEIGRMERTIQGLLDFSRPAQPQRHRQDFRTAIRRAINLVNSRMTQCDVRWEVALGEEVAEVDADSDQLLQVVVNLLLNCIEAMPQGGKVKLTLHLESETQQVVLTVDDTGPGIDSSIIKRIFEPFASTKIRGTGLGLAICRRILEQHGGRITAENLPERGARFRVWLPVSESLTPTTHVNLHPVVKDNQHGLAAGH